MKNHEISFRLGIVFAVLICVASIGSAQTILTLAGNGSATYTGDGIPAASAALNHPRGAAADLKGNIFVADVDNNRVRRIGADGTIFTVAGVGVGGFSGDGGLAT